MKIIILGGTGFVGSYLKEYLEAQSHDVVALGRKAYSKEFDLTAKLENQDLLIVLTGENIGKRWSAAYKKALLESRILTNKLLKLKLQACQNPPKRIFSASAIGFYPENTCENILDESHTEPGKGFLGQLGKQWEETSLELTPKPLIMRFGVVLGNNGGALQKMLPPFKMGLGGPVAGGQQCFSWIHIEDLARAVSFFIEKPELEGVFNLTSPNPVTSNVFGKALAKAIHRPFWLPLPEFQLKLMFGEGAQVLTHSSAIVPTKLIESGFDFKYPEVATALKNIVE